MGFVPDDEKEPPAKEPPAKVQSTSVSDRSPTIEDMSALSVKIWNELSDLKQRQALDNDDKVVSSYRLINRATGVTDSERSEYGKWLEKIDPPGSNVDDAAQFVAVAKFVASKYTDKILEQPSLAQVRNYLVKPSSANWPQNYLMKPP